MCKLDTRENRQSAAPVEVWCDRHGLIGRMMTVQKKTVVGLGWNHLPRITKPGQSRGFGYNGSGFQEFIIHPFETDIL